MAILGMLRRNFVQNIDSVRMNFVNLALFGTIFLLLHFGVEAESSSTCSLPGLPGRDGLPGQPGRDGRDGLSGAMGPPGGMLGTFTLLYVIHFDKADECRVMAYTCNNETLPTTAAPGSNGLPGTCATLGGTTYIRWGRTVCPNVTGTELVYSGLAAGSHWLNNGGGANYICTASGADVEYHPEATTTNTNTSTLYGTEYEFLPGQPLAEWHNYQIQSG